MKYPLHYLTFLFLAFAAHSPAADNLLQPGDFVAICGDSITEQRQYSVFMEDYFLMCQPAPKIRAFEFGWGGETMGGFSSRFQNDVRWFKPTVATLCYGMNDGHYIEMKPQTADEYREAAEQAIKQLKEAGTRVIVVGSPGVVDPVAFKTFTGIKADAYNETLKAIGRVAQEVAQKEGVVFADINTPMMDVMQKSKAAYGQDYQFIAGGGIHPNNNGHIVMAYAFLKALGCDGAIGTITVDMASGTAEGTDGQKILSCNNGVVTVESSRYPFCFQGDPDHPGQNAACVLKFFPFNEDLNRYQLVVKGLTGTKAKVTWGSSSKEFATADLAKGINLAAEFLTNPFSSQFELVHTAVDKQQAAEVGLIKDLLHGVPHFEAIAPNSQADFEDAVAKGVQRDEELYDAAAALVTPVQHTITIEPES